MCTIAIICNVTTMTGTQYVTKTIYINLFILASWDDRTTLDIVIF